MRKATKMLMLSEKRGGYDGMRNETEMRGGNYGGRNEMRYDGSEMRNGDYDMESRRRRDSRGRFRSEMDDMESYDRAYSNYGREMRDNYDMRDNDRARMGGYPNRPFPVYEGGRSNMNQIGFNANEVRTNYGMNAAYNMGNEMEHRSSPKMGGYASDMSMPMTKEMAEEWTEKMKNEDGTKGPHWTMEQTKQVMAQKGVQVDPVEFWTVMNMLYSDYGSVFKKHGITSVGLYVDLACAWINDKDAVPNKTATYYETVVKK